LNGSLADFIESVRQQRSDAWLKMRVNRGQEFVIGG
jgi:hypothetical protein